MPIAELAGRLPYVAPRHGTNPHAVNNTRFGCDVWDFYPISSATIADIIRNRERRQPMVPNHFAETEAHP